MSRDYHIDISVKPTLSSSHKLYAGNFPQDFNGNPKNTTLELKQKFIIAKEETVKLPPGTNPTAKGAKVSNESQL